MRLFVAVPLPPEIAAAGAAALPALPALRPVRPDVMHVTLAFLGAVPEPSLADVVDAVRAAGAGRESFRASVDHLGQFPPRGAPRIVWLGISAGAAELTTLAAAVRGALAARAIPFDAKPFQAHVTLARVRDDADPADRRRVAQTVERARIRPMAFDVTEYLLLESVLSPTGPRYTPRAAVPLGVGTG